MTNYVMRREDQEAAVHTQGKMVAQLIKLSWANMYMRCGVGSALYGVRASRHQKVPAGESTPSPQPLGLLLLVEWGIVHT